MTAIRTQAGLLREPVGAGSNDIFVKEPIAEIVSATVGDRFVLMLGDTEAFSATFVGYFEAFDFAQFLAPQVLDTGSRGPQYYQGVAGPHPADTPVYIDVQGAGLYTHEDLVTEEAGAQRQPNWVPDDDLEPARHLSLEDREADTEGERVTRIVSEAVDRVNEIAAIVAGL